MQVSTKRAGQMKLKPPFVQTSSRRDIDIASNYTSPGLSTLVEYAADQLAPQLRPVSCEDMAVFFRTPPWLLPICTAGFAFSYPRP
jgi:hypothetical protein